ncbi:partitioning defective 3 homolog B [Protopterus annectens]|uniref:partitioning defective 3 homolog B n=1 Tax=Protopterus annectens TaxID=7888 RepID=UPI001CFB9CB9|nr:partitioning defective 3 homolog B [Protopterus annectens]
MKVTVCFGKVGIVVPCKDGNLTVGQLLYQATQRYMKTREKDTRDWVKIHHLEYTDGGILDPDDVLADVVEDKDKLIAVYTELESQNDTRLTNGSLTERPSLDVFENELATHHVPFHSAGREIEVTTSALKSSTPLLVRRSSDPALAPPLEFYHSESQLKPSAMVTDKTSFEDGGEDLGGRSEQPSFIKPKITFTDTTRKVHISGEGDPLGIHVVPFCSSFSGRPLGLFIRNVEENSRSRREGLFKENECIVKINGIDLMDKTFTQSQEIFRHAMKSASVELAVVPEYSREHYEKSAIGPLFSIRNEDGVLKTKVAPPVPQKPPVKNSDVAGIQNTELTGSLAMYQGSTSPAKSSSPVTLGWTSPSSTSPLGGFGNRKNGKKVRIDLKKGQEGLGFTVVTKDASVHGPSPVFVKSILPKGAAVKDGRLQSGDRILEVRGQSMPGRSREEMIVMLKASHQGELSGLFIQKKGGHFIPSETKGEPDIIPSLENKEQLMFEVPLNDSGSAGLGVSLKGNKSRETGSDLGIFIKSIIHGGAAYKDGRLRVNDQLIAVNGESLLGKSNHDALETLRRSMSMEGNIRGLIQLVVARKQDRQLEDPSENVSSHKFVTEENHVTLANNNISLPHSKGLNNLYEKVLAATQLLSDNESEDDSVPLLPQHGEERIAWSSHLEEGHLSSGLDPNSAGSITYTTSRPFKPENQPDLLTVKGSKSMDLVADESKISLLSIKESVPPRTDLGPTLGLKKSSSLESLQTAVAEVWKNSVPFHRPRPNMVRGRGCNESFRAAIDKSYDGPPEADDDDFSDLSSHSGRETPGIETAMQEHQESDDTDSKTQKKKDKEKKKVKIKPKGKEKEQKKKKEDSNEQEKKAKKKGFGAMLRFGKKKEDKVVKVEQKGLPKGGKAEVLSEGDLEKMKEERERIEAKHQALREKQAREQVDYSMLQDMEDDEFDPDYARVNNFREMPPSQGIIQHSPQAIHYQREVITEQNDLDGLYAKVNKKRAPQPTTADSHQTSGGTDRIQQLRQEYQQARREAGVPTYEEIEGRQWPPDELARVPGRNVDIQQPVPRTDDMEWHYASLPRRGPVEAEGYITKPRSVYGEREPPHYPGAVLAGYHQRGNYPHFTDPRRPEYQNYRDRSYHLHMQQRGPFRQDVPPSPPQLQRPSQYSDNVAKV